MDTEIPQIAEILYRGLITGPNPSFWPDYLKNDPVMGHGLWSFYSGLKIGLQLGAACFGPP